MKMTGAQKLNLFSKNLNQMLKERNISTNWKSFSDPNYARYEETYQEALKLTHKQLEEMEQENYTDCMIAAGWI